MYHILWQFEVKPEAISLFEQRYGSQGDWAQLFVQASGYEGTLLLRDDKKQHCYITIDRWVNIAAFQQFEEQFAKAYKTMDKAFEGMTISERKIGDFTQL